MPMNYPYYPQQQPMTPYNRMAYADQTQLPQIGIKGHPVSSIDEVRATSVDFDGSVFYFPDLANKRIYTKQINLDGTSTLNVYELKNIPMDMGTGNYITREEFEITLNQLRSSLAQLTPQTSVPAETPASEPPQIKF